MSTSTRIVNAVASGSRRTTGPTVARALLVKKRQDHSATSAVPRRGLDLDPIPSLGKGKRREDLIRYSTGGAGHSNERLSYSQQLDGADPGGQELGADWVISGQEDIEGISPGRVVEARRNGTVLLGLVLSSLIVGGRPRALVLELSGEIWPISPQDVQFAMPSSLISADVTRQCWSPELLDSWKRGIEMEIEGDGSMSEARRKAVRVMRKVKKETERMCGRLVGRTVAGGVEGVWERWIAEGRTSITAAEAAEYLLHADADGSGKKKAGVQVKKNTLPAYAAHTLLMARPDLFLSDTGEMWKSGLFLIRSREDRDRLKRVEGWFDGALPDSKEIVDQFTAKARAAVAYGTTLPASVELQVVKHNLPEWTPEERDIISVLLARLYETRSTQVPPTTALSYLIMKAINVYPDEQVDQPLVKRFLVDIGALSSHDSLERARATETNRRTLALHGLSGRVLGNDDLLSGTELDDFREDFTGHTVYVIDDASASELDDGISIEHVAGGDYWVHVHVADPTRYLRPEHPTAVRASAQGSALYTPEGNLPLIPLGITMKELSLGGSKDKQGVMTFSALISDDGSLRDEKVRMGWIKSPRVITYSSVNGALGLSTKSPPTRPFGTPVDLGHTEGTKAAPDPSDIEGLRVLHDFAAKHRQRRYLESGIEWALDGGDISLLSKLPTMSIDAYNPSSLASRPQYHSGEPVIDYTVPSGASTSINAQAIVAECMILAGKIAASFCHQNGIAAPFRGSVAPKVIAGSSALTLENLLASRNQYGAVDPFRMKEYDIYLPPGTLSSTLVPHWIMGLTQPDVGYLRATSPLRRYDDLLVHWQIKAHLAGSKGMKAPWSMMNGDEILTLGQRSDAATKRNKRAGANAEAWWLSRLIRSRLQKSPDDRYRVTDDTLNLHDPLEARVSGPPVPQRDGATYSQVWVPGLGTSAQLAVPKSTNLPVGETVRVKVTSAELDPVPIVFTSLVE